MLQNVGNNDILGYVYAYIYCLVAQSRQSKGFGSTPKGFHPPTVGFRVGEEGWAQWPWALGWAQRRQGKGFGPTQEEGSTRGRTVLALRVLGPPPRDARPQPQPQSQLHPHPQSQPQPQA